MAAEIDTAAIAASQRRSRAAALAWRDGAACRAIDAALARAATEDAEAIAACIGNLLADDALIEALFAPLVAALRDDPWFEPPFKTSRDPRRIGAVLYEVPQLTLTATVLDRAATHLPPTLAVASGRLAVTRYWRAGGAVLHRWRAGPIAADFTLAMAPPLEPLAPLPLEDGMVVTLDGRTAAHLIRDARCDVVTLTAMIRPGAAPFAREYRLPDGVVSRIGMIDDQAARQDLLLALLRAAGRADAAACFDMHSRDASFFRRWSAMREWLALDVASARPRLRDMAASDPHPDIRAAATTMLARVDAMAVPCPA